MKDTEGAPRLLVVAGPNGSGKTTLTTRLRELGLDFGEYVNADEIALTLPPTKDRDRLAQLEADRRRRRLLEGRQSFSFETVMSHPSKIDEMREAKALGFHFTFYFVAVAEPGINLKRVSQRVRMGGHDVPADRVVARYYRTMELMPEAILLADQSFVFDNSNVSTGPSLQVSFRRKDGYLAMADETFGVDMAAWVKEYVVGGVLPAAERMGMKVVAS